MKYGEVVKLVKPIFVVGLLIGLLFLFLWTLKFDSQTEYKYEYSISKKFETVKDFDLEIKEVDVISRNYFSVHTQSGGLHQIYYVSIYEDLTNIELIAEIKLEKFEIVRQQKIE